MSFFLLRISEAAQFGYPSSSCVKATTLTNNPNITKISEKVSLHKACLILRMVYIYVVEILFYCFLSFIPLFLFRIFFQFSHFPQYNIYILYSLVYGLTIPFSLFSFHFWHAKRIQNKNGTLVLLLLYLWLGMERMLMMMIWEQHPVFIDNRWLSMALKCIKVQIQRSILILCFGIIRNYRIQHCVPNCV